MDFGLFIKLLLLVIVGLAIGKQSADALNKMGLPI